MGPQWFILLFPYVLWPLGNIAITASVLMVVAVSTERYLAICRPLQYKPSPVFYVVMVLLIAVGVNTGRFLEYSLVLDETTGGVEGNVTHYAYKYSDFMQDSRYVRFSRYWNEIIVIGFAPLLALSLLNYGIYTKIRKSTKFRQLHDKSMMKNKQQQKSNNFHGSTLMLANNGSRYVVQNTLLNLRVKYSKVSI